MYGLKGFDYMRKTIKFILLLFAVCAVFGAGAHASGVSVSSWAESYVYSAAAKGLLPVKTYASDMTAGITRGEFCEVLIHAYAQTSPYGVPPAGNHFLDTDLEAANIAYELGIVSGDGEGNFNPEAGLNRQQAAVMLCNFAELYTEVSVPPGSTPLEAFTDRGSISDWAYDYVCAAVYNGFMSGMSETSFSPLSSITKEQAAIILTRMLDAPERFTPEITAPAGDSIIPSGQALPVQWTSPQDEAVYNLYLVSQDGITQIVDTSLYNITDIPAEFFKSGQSYYIIAQCNGALSRPVHIYADKYTLNASIFYNKENRSFDIRYTKPPTQLGAVQVDVTEVRDTVHGGEIEPHRFTLTGAAGNRVTFSAEYYRKYSIKVTAPDGQTAEKSFTTGKNPMLDENNALVKSYVSPDGKTQTQITVNVWRLKDGRKYSSTAELTVHRAVADRVAAAFEEIYEGSEQFPILDIGAYADRGDGGKSEHNRGTAIDINAQYNYCIYSNGTAIGSCWAPYENPYSILPYGEVVCAFEHYGFIWGGDYWRNPRDYMHFSLGT